MASKNARSTVMQAGVEEGKRETKVAVLTWLENRYVHDREKRPDRGSPEAQFMLELVNDLTKYIDTLEV